MQNHILKSLCIFSVGSCSKRKLKKILIITSNQKTCKYEINTSNHFAEIVLAYDEFVNAGYDVDFLSPKGGKIWVGYINDTNVTQKILK